MTVGEELHDAHADQQDHHQDKGHGSGEMQVVGHILAFDGITDQEELLDAAAYEAFCAEEG